MNIVVFLQNAWSPVYAGGEWPRESWLRALERSRSGNRLKALLDDFDVCENTTPLVGAQPSSKLPPDAAHITEILLRRRPRVVIACGLQAEQALSLLWNGPFLAVPHPACRVLTDDLYQRGREIIKTLHAGRRIVAFNRLALRQHRGRVVELPLPTFAMRPCIIGTKVTRRP